MWNFIDPSEILQTRFMRHRQETPSTVRVNIQWTGGIKRTMAYIFFFSTLQHSKIWIDGYSSKNILPVMRNDSRFYITHTFLFFLGVLNESVVFYLVQSYT